MDTQNFRLSDSSKNHCLRTCDLSITIYLVIICLVAQFCGGNHEPQFISYTEMLPTYIIPRKSHRRLWVKNTMLCSPLGSHTTGKTWQAGCDVILLMVLDVNTIVTTTVLSTFATGRVCVYFFRVTVNENTKDAVIEIVADKISNIFFFNRWTIQRK